MCEKSHEKKGTEPPCGGCQNEPPDPDPENALFDVFYERARMARDGDGTLVYGVLMRMLELEGLPGPLQSEILEKAVRVEEIVRRRQFERIEREREQAPRKK